MPFTLNGIGTTYYAARERAEDGSCVTTLFFVVFAVPIIPLASYRVLATGKPSRFLIVNSQNYRTRKIPLHWKQVGNVYFATIGLLGALALFFWGCILLLNWYTKS